MKKKAMFACLTAIMMTALVGFSACGETPDDGGKNEGHKHTYATTWSFDDTDHWHKATCDHKDEVSEKAKHVYGDDNKCDVCGYEKEEPSTPGDDNPKPSADAPVIVHVPSGKMYGTAGSTINYGTLSVMLNGKSLKDYEIKDEKDPDAVIDTNASSIVSNVYGTHTIKVTAKNPDDETKTAETSFEVNIYRRLFNANASFNGAGEEWGINSPSGELFDPDDPVGTQYANFIGRDGSKLNNYLGALNLQPSKYYYAEAELTGFTVVDQNNYMGMAHVASLQNIQAPDFATARFLVSAVTLEAQYTVSLNGWLAPEEGHAHALNVYADEGYKGDGAWTPYLNDPAGGNAIFTNFTGNQDNCYSEEAVGLKEDGSLKTFKYAVARAGDLFFSFVNDKLAGVYANDFYATHDTVPALYGRLHSEQGRSDYTTNPNSAKNIDFFDGQEKVLEKINALVAGNTLAPWGANFAADCVGNEAVTLGDKATVTADGLSGGSFTVNSMDSQNNRSIVPMAAFAGSYTLEFDYIPKTVSDSADGECVIDLRGTYGANLVRSRMSWNHRGAADWIGSIGSDFTGKENAPWNGSNQEVLPMLGAGFAEGIHVKLTRELDTEGKKTVYTIVYSRIGATPADKGSSWTETYTDTSESWNAVQFPILKTIQMTAEWKNISFKGHVDKA